MAAFTLLRRLYLSIYNWIVFIGWFQILFLAVKTLKKSCHENFYNAVEIPLILAQSAAVLEILHGLIGLVRSPVSSTLPQIGSRLYLTWEILWSFPEMIDDQDLGFFATFLGIFIFSGCSVSFRDV